MRYLLFLCLCCSYANLSAWQQVNAFVYHRFGDDRYPSTNISIQNFERQLKYLKENGYQTISMSEALEVQRSRSGTQQKLVALTIDDAYVSFYEHALPLLDKYNMTATLFVNTATIGAPDFMSWQQLKKAQTLGIEIGNHSHSHAYFLNETLAEFKDDLDRSHELIKETLGLAPKVYAYPYGEWNLQMIGVLKEAGYLGAAAQHSGVLHPNSALYALPRFPMSNAYAQLDDFAQKLKMNGFQEAQSAFFKEGDKIDASPYLTLTLAKSDYSMKSIQGFIAGQKAELTLTESNERLKVKLWTNEALSKRRTLFTITAKDNSGNWHWMSHVYVQPQIGN